MAEIDRIVVLDIERDGSSSTTAEQEMVILRNDLASTDPTKGAGMVGYRSSESYSGETVGKALTDIENNMSAVEDSASQALTKSNEALAKATTAESKIDNALLKGNNLSDLTNKVAALENIGAVPLEDIVLDPTANKTPKAGDDGKIGMNWVRDLEYELSNIQRDIEKIEYPDGIVPFIDWDFTSGQLPSNFMFRRGTEATYFDKFGVLRTAQAGEPVFEYDPVTKEALGLRRERESSNRMSYSNFNSTYWSAMAGAVVNVNYSLSPDGTVTSNFLTTDATEEAPKVPYIHRRYIQYDAGKDYTFSVFLKINPNMDSSKVVRFVLHAEVFGSPNRNVYFVPATGRVYVSTGSEPKDWGYKDCGGGWIRVWMTDTVSADWNNGTGYGPLLWFSNFISQGQGVEWWGMQVEEGVSPTSYIPTNGEAKTRLREEIQYQADEGIYLSSKATVYLDYTPVFSIPAGRGVNGGFALVIGERNNAYNYLGIDYDNVPLDGRTQSYLRDSPDTGNKGTITAGVKEFGKPLRYACSFSTERVMHSSCNGSDIRSAPNDPVMNSYFELCNRITLFGSTSSGTGPVMGAGWFRKVQIYNEVFDDEKLIRLSSGEGISIEDSVVMIRPSLTDGTDLSTVRKPGDYLLQTSSTYSGLPDNFPTGAAILNVRRTDYSITQILTPSSSTSVSWKRSVFGPPDTATLGVWLQPGYDFIGSISNGNAFSQTIPGCYTLTGNVTNLPSGWPEGVDAVLRIKRDGGRTRQEIYPVTDPSLIWRRFSGGTGWRQVAGANLTAPENFSRNYAYRRLVAQGNVNDLIDEGRYIITQPGTGLPADAPNQSAFIDVEVYGSFVFQTVRYRNSMRYIWQRSGNMSGSSVTWQGYERIGGSGGAGGNSSLSGSIIAVIGDSIVEGGDWPERLADATGATVHKFGFGGCRMSAYPTSVGRYDGMCGYAIATCIGSGDYTYLLDCAEVVAQPPTSDDNRPQAAALAALDWSTVDILVIAFGTNDWTRPDLDLGTGYAADPTGMTLRGSVAHIINEIQTAYPNIRIVFQLPSYRTFGGGPNADEDAWVARTNSIALTDVNDAIADVAQRNGCPSMDMLRGGTVNAYTADHYLQDGIHPRPGVGFDLWAKRIAGWLNSIA